MSTQHKTSSRNTSLFVCTRNTTKPSLRKTTQQIGPFPSAALGTQSLLQHTHTNKLTKLPCNTAHRNLSTNLSCNSKQHFMSLRFLCNTRSCNSKILTKHYRLLAHSPKQLKILHKYKFLSPATQVHNNNVFLYLFLSFSLAIKKITSLSLSLSVYPSRNTKSRNSTMQQQSKFFFSNFVASQNVATLSVFVPLNSSNTRSELVNISGTKYFHLSLSLSELKQHKKQTCNISGTKYFNLSLSRTPSNTRSELATFLQLNISISLFLGTQATQKANLLTILQLTSISLSLSL